MPLQSSAMPLASAPALTPIAPVPVPAPAVLRRFDCAGPRYTSYPTADRFVDAFTADDYAQTLEQRGKTGASARALSLYVHIPFCESLCYYCACNKIITRKHERGAAYLRRLAQEVALYTEQLGPG